MILLTYRAQTPGGLRLAVKTEYGVIDVEAARHALGLESGTVPDTPEVLFRQGLDTLPALVDFVTRLLPPAGEPAWLLDEASLTLGPCVPHPGKIICVGLNYRRHIAEAGADVPDVPVLFSKFANALAASGEPVPLPAHVVQYDYEAELAAVIGRCARYIPESEALDYVFGYCNANDISARELQGRTSQWLLGKTLDRFFPIGPYLVTADEVADPQQLPIRCWLNGELRQDSSTADMLFSVARIISYASHYMTLNPGDVISTGTPEGVVLGMANKVWMKPGDEVSVEVGNLGRLTNRMVNEGGTNGT
jgi:2-keto-4-pentenoate hydratase/2-oxohepta-3-ene-1,7-dioic acid hydratase in catechol pathway